MKDGEKSSVAGDPSSLIPHPSSPISHPSSLISHPPTIWLGDAVEIKQPTAIAFRRQTGANMLLVGNDPEAALGTMATAIVAVGASRVESRGLRDETGGMPPVLLLDGSPRESPQAEYWRAFAKVFADCVELVGPRDAAGVMARLAAEQAQRAADRDVLRPPAFVFVYNLSRFRDLRKAEDDFGMGAFGGGGTEKPIEPGKLFADLLAGGPECGLHTVVWCDSYNNVERWFSRQSLRELEYRVAFQMNAADSSNLIDSAAASKLGVHRALLYREETGASEKFRPYGAPDVEWLRRLRGGESGANEAPPVADLDAFQVE
jgi:hypothetical protein